jgi:hypothetical protein
MVSCQNTTRHLNLEDQESNLHRRENLVSVTADHFKPQIWYLTRFMTYGKAETFFEKKIGAMNCK